MTSPAVTTTEVPMLNGGTHINLTVLDLDLSTEWYCRALGFRVVRDARPQESGFRYFQRITRFTGPVVASAFAAHPVPTLLTCGTVEENLANNREMAEALARTGYPAELVEVPDGHHFTAWRDAFDPHLTRLLARSWGETSWSLGSWGPGAWGGRTED